MIGSGSASYELVRALVDQNYGLGRVIDYRDMPAVRAIRAEAAQQDNRFSAFILGIVKSGPFQMSRAEEVEGEHVHH